MDYIEPFVLERLAEYVFGNQYISKITKEYNQYLKSQNGESDGKLKALQSRLNEVIKNIDKVVDLLVKIASDALVERLNALENEKMKIECEIGVIMCQTNCTSVTEREVAETFGKIRNLLTAGELKNIRQVIDTYIQKVVVYPEKVIVYFNFFPKITLAFNEDQKSEEGTKNEACAGTQSSSTGQPFNQSTIKMADDFGGGEPPPLRGN